MNGTSRWLMAWLLAGLLTIVGMAGTLAHGTSDAQAAVPPHTVISLSTDDAAPAPVTADDADTDEPVSALPSTGRGSVMTGSDTHEIVTQQLVRTVLVLAAVVSIAFGGLVLYARQKEL